MISQHVNSGELIGINLTRSCPTLFHYFFVDDVLFFMNAKRDNCQLLGKILNDCCVASSQIANLDKSGLFFFSNSPEDVKSKVYDVLGVNDTSNLGKYLGLPIIRGRFEHEALAFVRDKIAKKRKIQNWKHGLLSEVRREILIKAVASS